MKPIVPVGTTEISYTVSIDGNLVFLGKTKYFGGDYEVDCSDYIESQIFNGVSSGTVSVVFTYDGSNTQTLTTSWAPETINLDYTAASNADAYIMLSKCGFVLTGNKPVYVPLKVYNGYVVGKTNNKLEKVTYIDSYGDAHNGGMSNRYEIECYIDPSWLGVNTINDLAYEQVMMALQYAGYAALYVNPSTSIKGMSRSISGGFILEGRVKDVEKIELYSQYSVNKKVPTLKITFEIYK